MTRLHAAALGALLGISATIAAQAGWQARHAEVPGTAPTTRPSTQRADRWPAILDPCTPVWIKEPPQRQLERVATDYAVPELATAPPELRPRIIDELTIASLPWGGRALQLLHPDGRPQTIVAANPRPWLQTPLRFEPWLEAGWTPGGRRVAAGIDYDALQIGRLDLRPTISIGLTDSDPDFFAGLRLTWR